MSRKLPVVSTAVLLAGLLGLAVAEQHRPWQETRIRFHELERKALEVALAEERARAEAAGDLDAEVEAAEESLRDRSEEARELEEELYRFRHKLRRAESRGREARARLEEARYRGDEPASARWEEEAQVARREAEGFQEMVEDREAQLEGLRTEVEAAAARRREGYRGVREIEGRLAALERRSLWDRLPGLDPALPVIEQDLSPSAIGAEEDAGGAVVVRTSGAANVTQRASGAAGVTQRASGAANVAQRASGAAGVTQRASGAAGVTQRASGATRVDRCVTCHLGVIRTDLDTSRWPAPLGSHPRPELFAGESSPHPSSRLGCTVCHGGDGRSTDFVRAGHLPRGEEQREAWSEKWGWRPEPRLAMPILAPPLTASRCGGCHDAETSADEGRARQLIRNMGCLGCHDAGRARDHQGSVPKPGPTLSRLARKTRPEWARRFIDRPRDFRATTWMPSFSSAEGEVRRNIEIAAMVAYLWREEDFPGGAERRSGTSDDAPGAVPRTVSETVPDDLPGDLEAGRDLFRTVGCTGCHLLDPQAERDVEGRPFERLFGPNLTRLGSKVRASWLRSWLLDPAAHRADTPMPDLRLSETEADDLTAFLMSRRDAAWEGLELRPIAPGREAAERDAMVLEHLRETETIEAGLARLEAMSDRERNVYLGRRRLALRACHGCHDILGLEDVPVPAPRLRELRSRRILGATGIGVPHDGTGAGLDYGLSEREAEVVLTAVLGWTEEAAQIRRNTPHRVDADVLARGEALIARTGCRGCHRLGGRGQGLEGPGHEGPGREGPGREGPGREGPGREGAGSEAASPAGPGPAGPGPAGPGPAGPDLGGSGSGVSPRAPDLSVEGSRVRPSWLFDYLGDPGEHVLRPWLDLRMPTYRLTTEEKGLLVRYFAARESRDLFIDEPPLAAADVAVGQAVAAILECQRCHEPPPESSGRAPDEIAPSYGLSRQRLRPEWVVEWILDPRSVIPGTAMPESFGRGGDGRPDSSFLTAAITAPMFDRQYRRVADHFDSEDELRAYLEDPERVARAIRDYLWSQSR